MQHLGLVAGLVLAVVLTAIVLLTGRDSSLTISLHVAKTRAAQVVFGVTMVAVVVGFVWFLIGYMAPHYGMSPLFYIATVVMACQLVLTGVFPHTVGLSARLHDFGSRVMVPIGILLAVDLGVESFWQTGITVKILLAVFVAYGAYVIFLFVRRRKAFRRRALLLESLYIGWFWLVLLGYTYL